ncbi:hypothetical protein OQZ33_06730 [Pedobacter sp. MC2016-05]|uniref:hypothetical protein n=1 Tax=Pedobacter sp. MC2016-05 TaxID=2994474 RepID=UPI002246EE45|nr:hypothetical protein [Pedobacter sp. MC2016-05]MCX2474021.1 hypothetical protein [Pedobacter sp. MC2016-05]
MIIAEKKATIKSLVYASIGFALLFGIFIAFTNGIWYALIAGPITGALWGLLMYLFINSKKVKEQTIIEGVVANDIIYSGGANHFKNAEAVGGKLYLLSNHLEFKSHQFNIQNHTFAININDIQDIISYNTLGLIPNGLKIILKDGAEEKFVVNHRDIWKKNIQILIDQPHSQTA